jgi:hypothetical protein
VTLTRPAAGFAADPPPSAGAADRAARQDEVRRLMRVVRDQGFYGLRDPKPARAVEALRRYADDDAPAVAALLVEGLKNRGRGWIEVYRPLYLLKGMGPAGKVALPDVVKALDDQHPINVGAAAEVLADIGPAAKEAVPALTRAWERSKTAPRSAQDSLAAALKKLDPEAAARVGIK